MAVSSGSPVDVAARTSLIDRQIDLLVTDVGLPNLNGKQLADLARQHRPNLKILS
jgi:hypothetical protein